MAVYRVQVATEADSAFPRDNFVNTLHFQDTLDPGGMDDLLLDIATAYQAEWYTVSRKHTLKLYDTAGPPPHPPLATYIHNPAQAPVATTGPRELALCLSFSGGINQKHQRGRIFLAFWPHYTTPGLRPDTTRMTDALDLGTAFGAAGGPSTKWGVWSSTHQEFTQITQCWCDDEWDVQRRRGLRPTARVTRAITA